MFSDPGELFKLLLVAPGAALALLVLEAVFSRLLLVLKEFI